MKKLVAVAALAAALAGCDAPADTIAGKIASGVEKACAFRVDYAWMLDTVTKLDVTIQMADQLVAHICDQFLAARSGALGLIDDGCKWGSIVVNGEKVCIEGEPVPAEPEKKE